MRIGILQTGHVPEEMQAQFTDYAQLFERLLDGHGFEYRTWNVVDGDFPDSIDAADGWLVTGSRHGAYEDHPWIPPLEDFIRALHDAERPLVGICFGHQIIAQALGGKVEKFSGGWSVGRRAYAFGDSTLHLNAWHQDQVVRPPDGARTLAKGARCVHAALAIGDHIFTVQPHPEFGHDFVAGLIETRGPGVVPEAQLAVAEAELGEPLDRGIMADRLAAVLKGAAP